MTDTVVRDPYSALRHAGFRRYLVGNFLSNIGRQGLSVAIAWQIYKWTNSASALGLVGLVSVLPLIAFVLPAGALADRLDRRKILMWTTVASAALSLALVLLSTYHTSLPNSAPLRLVNELLRSIALYFERHVDPTQLHFDNPALPLIFLILLLQAFVRVLGNPARAALVPLLVEPTAISNAITWSSSTFELSTVIGPALGGLLVALSGYTSVYLLDVFFSLTLVVLLLGVPCIAQRRRPVPPPIRSQEYVSSGAIKPSLPPSRSIFLPFCWAERWPCCQSMRIKFSTSDRPDSAGCAQPRRWVRSPWHFSSPIFARPNILAWSCSGRWPVSARR